MALSQEAAGPPLPHGDAAHSDEDSDVVEEFEDATDEQPPVEPDETVDIHAAFDDCEYAIMKFFNNDPDAAMNLMKPWERTSMYHSLGASIFEFIPAMLTFDHAQINRTLEALKLTISICNRTRKNFSFVETIGTILKKPNYASYTDVEAHAELCYAEALLLQAAMTIMEGEDLAGLIRGTIKVKHCYNSYKECSKILEKKKWTSTRSFAHFQSGVRLGVATFNLMISLLPPKIISLLEFVGFSGNKSLGLAELAAGSRETGMRSVLCDLTLLAYHLVVCHFIGARADLRFTDIILKKQLQVYPESVWFLMFKGRLQFLRGSFDLAIETYIRAIKSQTQWRQFHHVCYWEIMWINGLKMEWREAASFAGKLMDQSSWSRTIYSYSRASMLLQLDNLNTLEILQINELLRNAAFYKQRIAGKSLPMEKFVIKRCARYMAQGERLVLPAVELLCLWNMFHILSSNEMALHKVLKLVETVREEIEKHSHPWMGPYEADNRALVRYLHGCLLYAIRLPRQALDAFNAVFDLKNDIREDTFLLPYTLSEIAMCHYLLGEIPQAMQLLQDARKKYSGYALESRLQFRLHSRMETVRNYGNYAVA